MVHKARQHIEIARSTIKSLSSLSQKSCDALYSVLKTHYTTVGISVVNNITDLQQLVAKQPDLVFVGLKYVPGAGPDDRIWVSAYLEQNGICHTGSPKIAIEHEQNKPLAKQRAHAAGIRTARFLVAEKDKSFDAARHSLRYPLFVKPVDLGAGQGVDDTSIVHNAAELQSKVTTLIADHDTDALVEEFLPGREFSVAVLKDEHSDELQAMPLELLPGPNAQGHRILSYELKSAPLETPVYPVTDKRIRAVLTDIAVSAFAALGARDYGRIDIRMDAAGTPHFLEANLIPCLIRGSGNFPKACAMNAGMSYETMILRIVRLGLMRNSTAEPHEPEPASLIHSTALAVQV